MEELARKKGRLKKQQKKKLAKSSSTLAGQASRMKTAKGYFGRREAGVKIKFD